MKTTKQIMVHYVIEYNLQDTIIEGFADPREEPDICDIYK